MCLGDTTGAGACAIIYSDDHYYIFHQHSRDRNDMSCENGTAVAVHFSEQRNCVHYIMQPAVSLVAPLFTLRYMSVWVAHHVERSKYMQAPCHCENLLPSCEQTKDATASERHASEYEVENTHINSVHSCTSVLGKHMFHEQMQQSKMPKGKGLSMKHKTLGI